MTARDRTVIVVVLALAAIVGSWLLVIQPKRNLASKLGDQVKSEQAQLDSVRAQVASGEAARRAYASSYTALVRLGEAVPADDNVPSLIVQVQGAASATDVDFRDVALAPGTASSTLAPTTPTSSSSATQASTASLPPGATVGPAGFPIEPFSFTFQGNFFHLANFFGRLQRFVVATNQRVSVSGRLMTLNAITLGASPAGFPQIQAQISATTYLVPSAEGLVNGASPLGPTGQLFDAVSLNAGRVDSGAHGRGDVWGEMSFFRDIINELREKRLWPVAVALLAALVAIPVFLSKSPGSKALAQIPSPSSPVPNPTALPPVSVSTATVHSKLSGPARDPFAQQKLGSGKSSTSSSTSGSSSSTGSGSTSSSVSGSTQPTARPAVVRPRAAAPAAPAAHPRPAARAEARPRRPPARTRSPRPSPSP